MRLWHIQQWIKLGSKIQEHSSLSEHGTKFHRGIKFESTSPNNKPLHSRKQRIWNHLKRPNMLHHTVSYTRLQTWQIETWISMVLSVIEFRVALLILTYKHRNAFLNSQCACTFLPFGLACVFNLPYQQFLRSSLSAI